MVPEHYNHIRKGYQVYTSEVDRLDEIEFNKKEKQIEELKNNVSRQKEAIKRKEEEVEKHHRKQVEALETISGLSAEEAKKELVETLKDEAKTHAMAHIQEIVEEAKLTANNDAKKIQELLAGTSDMVAGNVSFYVNYIREGKMRPVAVLDNVRSEYLPSVPTFGEVTGVENLGFAARTLIAANGLPQDKYDVFKNAINKAQANPGYQLAEMSKSSRIWTAAGGDLKDFIANTEKMVKVVEYWNQ
mgnify:CR=1 FL=1